MTPLYFDIRCFSGPRGKTRAKYQQFWDRGYFGHINDVIKTLKLQYHLNGAMKVHWKGNKIWDVTIITRYLDKIFKKNWVLGSIWPIHDVIKT